MQFKRTKCNCKECPLDGQRKVWSEYGVERPSIAFIAEAPGAQEDQLGRPLVGPSGSLIQQAAAKAGISWWPAYKMNVICCRPPDNEIGSVEGQQAMDCCRPGFEEELEFTKKLGVKVYSVLGATAMKALGIEGSLLKQRGSVNLFNKDRIAVPTFHPSYIMRGNWDEEVTWVNDLMKVRNLSVKKWKPPKENFNLFPSLKDVKEFVEQAIDEKKLVAFDLETTSLSPFYGKIIMDGLAMDGENETCVPFFKKGGLPYWSSKDEAQIWKLLRKLYENADTMAQNAMFDTWYLERNGIYVKKLKHDTMLLHHAIHPELPHNLGYIVSIYGDTPYWKDVVLGSEDKMIQMDDQEVRTYNARDTVVLHQILPGLLEDMKKAGTERTYYEWSMKLIEPLREMSNTGLLVDRIRMKGKASKFKREKDKCESEMRELLQLPDAFNFGSGDDMRLLVHGIVPKSQAKVNVELAKYEQNRKLRRDTKKYRELEAKRNLFETVKPLYKTSARIRTTDSGTMATDDEALLQIKRAALTRQEALGYLTRVTESHKREKEQIEQLLKFLELYAKYAVAEKLASTFSGFPIMPDGRVHPSFKIHGTSTGRLSSSDPNGQNIPAEVQDVFIAPPEKVIVKADYSNIELRVLSRIADEPELIKAFDSGENIHDVNTRLLFGIDKDNPHWKTIRRAAKVYVFGRSYGGTVEGIYKQLLTQVPELNMSFAHFKECDENYFRKLSHYKAWCEEQKKKAVETRVVETAFGRKRILLGLPEEIERQALNTPIQGTAGEIAEQSIIKLYPIFRKHEEWGARMILTVHDSILVECFEKESMNVARVMKKVMEEPYQIGKYKVGFPVDIGVGKTWADSDKEENHLEM